MAGRRESESVARAADGPDREALPDRGWRDALVHRIAAALDMPSCYMGGPSLPSRRKAERIVDLLPELEQWRPVMECAACGVGLNAARADNAGESGLCGACRDAADLRAENERLCALAKAAVASYWRDDDQQTLDRLVEIAGPFDEEGQ
jgi:hypothetical protein